MNAPDSPSNDQLHQQLAAHVEHVHASTDLTGPAMARAGRIRRRRHTLAATGAATAVLAVTAPFVWWNLQGNDPTPVPATTTTTTTGTSTSTAAPTPVPTETSAAPTATTPTTTPAAPSYAELADSYAVGDTLRVGGKTIQLERGTRVHDFAVLDGGRIMLTSSMDDETTDHEILDPAGRTLRRIDAPASDAPGRVTRWAVSPDGTRILFSTGEQVTVFDPSGGILATRSSPGEATAIVGDRAYLRGGDLDREAPSTEWDVATGGTRELPSGVRAVSRDGRLAAISWPGEYDDYRSCWAIIELDEGFRKVFERCGGVFIPQTFSAKGTYVVGQHYIDGGDVYNLAVARANDGTIVVGGEARADWFLGWTMRMSEDEQTLLVARNTTAEGADRANEVALVRCSLDLGCTTLEAARTFTTIGRPPFVVAR